MIEVSVHRELINESVTTVMSTPVLRVPEDADLLQVLAAMFRAGRRHLAVINAWGKCLGVVGDRAVAAAWAHDPAALTLVPVWRLLDVRPAIVGSDATVADVARLMHTEAVDAVAVVNRIGEPVGIVTATDVIALIARAIPASTDAARGSVDDPTTRTTEEGVTA
jgi:CBS domain-containing protein